MRALRLRRATDQLVPLPDIIRNAKVIVPSAPIDDQVQRAVTEARTIAFTLLRLSRHARPEFAWRCQRVGEQLVQALEESFGEDLT